MSCTRCGAAVRPDDRFCAACGAPPAAAAAAHNLEAAKALGLTIPQSVLARADET